MNWDNVLADLARKVEEFEQRLDAGVWEDLDQTPFAPPQVEGEMSARQRARAVALLERVTQCRKRLQGGMAETGQQLQELDSRRQGARSYASSQTGAR